MVIPEHVKSEWLEFARRTREARLIATRDLLTGRQPGDEAERVAPDEGLSPGATPGGECLSKRARSAGEATDDEAVLSVDNSEPLEFVNEAVRAALAVGRLVGPGGAGEGTCFMISPELLATADHCLPGGDDLPELDDWRVEFSFDRVTGEPVWPIEERPVPKGDVPTEWYSPTQPIPTNPPPFNLNTISQGVSTADFYFSVPSAVVKCTAVSPGSSESTQSTGKSMPAWKPAPRGPKSGRSACAIRGASRSIARRVRSSSVTWARRRSRS